MSLNPSHGQHELKQRWRRTLRVLLPFLAVMWVAAGSRGGSPASAADGEPPTAFSIGVWTTEDGLPANSVTALLQTRDGYLWVGTAHGLARFDGARFKVFNPANCPALPSGQIAALFELDDGTLLVGTGAGGLVALREGRFQRLLEPGREHDFLVACEKLGPGDWLLVGRSGVLSRWANNQITTLSTNRAFHPILPRSVCQDEQGTVWMLQQAEQWGRLLRFDGERLSEASLNGALAGSQSLALVKSAQGELWLGTSRGLARLRNGRAEPVKLPGLPQSALISDLLPCRDGGLWVRTENYTHRKLRNGDWVGPAASLQSVRTFARVLCEDRWGRLVLGGRYPEGLIFIHENGQITRVTEADGLPGMTVAGYLTDREGNDWLGLGDAGLVRLRPRLFERLPGAAKAGVEMARAVCEDRSGNVWVGTSMGGIYRFADGAVTHYGMKAMPLSHIWSLLEDSRSNLWVGTSWYGVYQFRAESFTNVIAQSKLPGRVNVLYEHPQGVLWLGCQNGLLSLQDGQLKAHPISPVVGEMDVKCIKADQRGRLWFGTSGSGLWCLENGKLSPFKMGGKKLGPIWSLHVDAEEVLWIGTRDGGLARLRDGQLNVFRVKDGLWDDTINHVAEDSQGRLWISSPQGVFHVDKRQLAEFAQGQRDRIACVGYDHTDGMPSSECLGGFQPAGWTTRDGRLLFPTLKGVAVLRPERATSNDLPPPVLIEEVNVDGRPATPVTVQTEDRRERDSDAQPLGFTIPPGKGRIEIHYTALSFSAPNRVRFQCRMEGMEPDWVDVGARRSVNYSYLRPGKYRFQVRACNNDGVWNLAGATLELRVQPHLWETWWFIGMLLAGGAAGIALTARRVEKQKARRKLQQLQQARALEQERTRIAKDIHDELGASLTRMTVFSELIKADKAIPDEVEHHAGKISVAADEAVKGLDAIVWAVNPRNDTLDSLLQYLSHYAYDFFQNTPVECQLDMPAEIAAVPLTAEVRHNLFLAVKEALNNVLKHAAASKVSLRVVLAGRELSVVITDNGHGFAHSSSVNAKPRRSGLENMRQRLEAIGGTLDIKSAPGQGTTVTLHLHLHAGDETETSRHAGRDGTGA